MNGLMGTHPNKQMTTSVYTMNKGFMLLSMHIMLYFSSFSSFIKPKTLLSYLYIKKIKIKIVEFWVVVVVVWIITLWDLYFIDLYLLIIPNGFIN